MEGQRFAGLRWPNFTSVVLFSHGWKSAVCAASGFWELPKQGPSSLKG